MVVVCPKCAQRYDVDEEYLGYVVDCENCGGQFLVEQREHGSLSKVEEVCGSLMPQNKMVDPIIASEAVSHRINESLSAFSQPQSAMRSLVCEMCGSSDFIKTEGVFVCQSCGTKYPVEEARKLMIDGTVNVTGTVKIDRSGELENVFKLARRARNTEDNKNAAKYYEQILQLNADSWEAAFYSVYCKAWTYNVFNVTTGSRRLENSIRSIVSLVDSEVSEDKILRRKIYNEISERVVTLGDALFNFSANYWDGKGAEHQNNVMAISDMCAEIGNLLNEKYQQDGQSVDRKSFLEPWKLCVVIRGDCGGDCLTNRDTFIASIQQYQHNYKPEFTERMRWRAVKRSFPFVILILCFGFGCGLPIMLIGGSIYGVWLLAKSSVEFF